MNAIDGKKETKDRLRSIFLDNLDGPLDEAMAVLNSIKEETYMKYQKDYKRFVLSYEQFSSYVDTYVLAVYGIREETDEEANARKSVEKRYEERERKQYEKLKQKYGDK